MATARAQRWEPVEVLKALLTEEAAGRERSAPATGWDAGRVPDPHAAWFDELIPKTLATPTIVDRLLHHAHVCQTSGDRVRLTRALAGRGVSPSA